MAESSLGPAVTAVETPIINSPYDEPQKYWKIETGKRSDLINGRRLANYFYRVPEHSGSGRSQAEPDLFESRRGEEVLLPIVNMLRECIKKWRSGSLSGGKPYEGVSPITLELLNHWRNENRDDKRLFFAQIEAAETIIFLKEGAKKYHKGLPRIPMDKPVGDHPENPNQVFVRYACKMATGTGKTTVMGMLAAWSILNHVVSRRDNRFSDTILIVCPNVTVHDRLKELDPALGDASLYCTRDLVPYHLMDELQKGEVMIANWHKLEIKPVNKIKDKTHKVIKTGIRRQIIKNKGKDNETIQYEYHETEDAWKKRIRKELGNRRGKSKHWLVFNDEAHHAYRRGNAENTRYIKNDDELARKNDKAATLWIEALDRIHRSEISGKSFRGINYCIDFSATPFYLQGTGNEVGRPFPWVVSDFSLLDAIESGLVKIPQLASQDTTGEDVAAYFNIWRWVEKMAKSDGLSAKSLDPKTILNYASLPIIMLAEEWRKKFESWQESTKIHDQNAVPPVFIIVCKSTKIAEHVYEWIANDIGDNNSAPELFRNKYGKEVTVRIDSKAMEEIEQDSKDDNSCRLRYIMETVGKTKWPGNNPPEKWVGFVNRHNQKVAENSDRNNLSWINVNQPPGRDIRCIVSVSMLTEGWDANNVTHIVGLRPFGSQLLCEQVVGRALRRKSYFVESNGLFAEETAKIFGVPFEVVPFKISDDVDSPPKPEPFHIYAKEEKKEYEITIPVVSSYYSTSSFNLDINWNNVASITIDANKMPDMVDMSPYEPTEGFFNASEKNETDTLTIEDWRKKKRIQDVAFTLAKSFCMDWIEENKGCIVPIQHLLAKMVNIMKYYIENKVNYKNGANHADLSIPINQKLVNRALLPAVKNGGQTKDRKLPMVYNKAMSIRSTSQIDFYTTKIIAPANRCHLNAMVSDNVQSEINAGKIFDTHPNVAKWVKNDHLGLYIKYKDVKGDTHDYIPDFVVVTKSGKNLIVEIKGIVDNTVEAKSAAAKEWVEVINNTQEHGEWEYFLVMYNELYKLKSILDGMGLI